jgi:hypothetical protein
MHVVVLVVTILAFLLVGPSWGSALAAFVLVGLVAGLCVAELVERLVMRYRYAWRRVGGSALTILTLSLPLVALVYAPNQFWLTFTVSAVVGIILYMAWVMYQLCASATEALNDCTTHISQNGG